MSTKKAASLFISTIVGAFIMLFTLLYVYDPLSVFHMPFSRDFAFSANNMRQQNIALLRHFDFDSIIWGNSYVGNTSSKEAAETFGGNFMNLSMSGSTLHEQSFVLNYALQTRKIKTVYAIFSESAGKRENPTYPWSNWTFLYDANPLNDFKVYLNRRYLSCAFMWSDSQECIGNRAIDHDRPDAWFHLPENAVLFGGVDTWIAHSEYNQINGTLNKTLPTYAEKHIKNLDSEIAQKGYPV